MTKLPSDALKTPARPVRTALIATATVMTVAAAGFFGIPALAQVLPSSAVTPTATPTATITPLTPAELDAVQQAADLQHAQILADQQAAADAAAAQAAAQAAAAAAAQPAPAPVTRQSTISSSPSKHPSGTPVTFVPSSDSQNANGGDYIDPSIFCQSGSASTVNGVPTCD
jgi:hypothetical protein